MEQGWKTRKKRAPQGSKLVLLFRMSSIVPPEAIQSRPMYRRREAVRPRENERTGMQSDRREQR
ncbi:MAG: hypothetical protein K0R89_1472 [Ramlibacter sp.]|nr:hypothetical protein [Ramlibacter sp.]